MQTIVAIARHSEWQKAVIAGEYKLSTINSTLDDVGFIHCTNPDQTIDTANRRYTDQDDLLLLFIDVAKVIPEVKFESALSGRAGLFPHIYGPLNTNAVYGTASLAKDSDNHFITPAKLQEKIDLMKS